MSVPRPRREYAVKHHPAHIEADSASAFRQEEGVENTVDDRPENRFSRFRHLIILVRPKQITGEYFFFYRSQFIDHAIGNDDITIDLESIEILHDFQIQKPSLIQ